jgi:predicted amidophosphoribosyltransferase
MIKLLNDECDNCGKLTKIRRYRNLLFCEECIKEISNDEEENY